MKDWWCTLMAVFSLSCMLFCWSWRLLALYCRHFSLADIVYTPAMERLGANLPVMRSFNLRNHPTYPNVAQWFAALDERPAYQRVKSDDMTHNLVFRCTSTHESICMRPGSTLYLSGI